MMNMVNSISCIPVFIFNKSIFVGTLVRLLYIIHDFTVCALNYYIHSTLLLKKVKLE